MVVHIEASSKQTWQARTNHKKHRQQTKVGQQGDKETLESQTMKHKKRNTIAQTPKTESNKVKEETLWNVLHKMLYQINLV